MSLTHGFKVRNHWRMYAKIFTQIFDSSIAENYEVRHVFEDLLKLADQDGVVDITAEAISRRTNVPLDKVLFGIGELMKPDPRSRSKDHDGRRLVPIDSRRDWGWLIVNYQHYRAVQDEEARRSYFRDAKKRERAKKKSRKAKRTLAQIRAENLSRERRADEAEKRGDQAGADAIAAENLPNGA